jgi:polyferredoxin
MKSFDTSIRLAFFALFVFLTIQGKMRLWLLLFALSLPAAALFGRLYCGYVCPIHTVMRPVSTLSSRRGWQKSSAPRFLSNKALPWAALAISVTATVIARRTFQLTLPLLPFWIAAGALTALFFRPEVFHNRICPFGALQKIFGRFARSTRQVDPAACIRCGLCEKACQTDAVHLSGAGGTAEIDVASCHQCRDCTAVCPVKAIAKRKQNAHQ